MTHVVTFPGLGLTFTLNRVAFTIPIIDRPVYWYGIIIVTGLLLAVYLCMRWAPRFGIVPDHIIDMMLFAVPAALIAIRAYYVIFNLGLYQRADGSLDWAAILRYSDGGLAIYSAGNESKNISNFPGGYSKCISVTSIGPDCLPAYYTCYGQGCNIAAPGGEIVGFSGGERAGVLSTTCSELTGSDYGYMQGTSMACPHMSGVAALGLSYALSKGKHYTRDEFISMLLTAVNEIDSRFEGTKSTGAKITLEDYRGKMGTGLTDAYQLLMQIEGTPCLKVSTNKLELITLTKHFGGSAQDLTYLDVEMSKEDMDKLGITSAPKMYNGQLMIKCTKPGVARIKVSAVGGGTRPGSETIMGGIEISKEFAIIARETGAENGGWL